VIGHVTDLEDKYWAIWHLVVETGHWLSGKEIKICEDKVFLGRGVPSFLPGTGKRTQPGVLTPGFIIPL
jgi:hypothetical protein